MLHTRKNRIVLIAGEPSGDFLGSQLMKALKEQKSSIEFFGIGGDLMEKEGLQSFFPLSDLSIMSVFENLGHTFRAWKRLNQTVDLVVDLKPDIIITLDFPGFNFRLSRILKKRLENTPLIHYVAPTVWAWRSGRAKKIAKFLDHLLTLFSFEPPYFEKHKLTSTFVGHPILEMGLSKGNKERFMKKYGVSKEETVLTVLPGSRMVELRHHLGIFQKAVDLISKQIPRLRIVIPTLPHLKTYIQKHWKSSVPAVIIEDLEEKKDAYATSSMAIAASGTIALELSQARLPMIIAYKVSRLSAWIIKLSVKVKYCCMVNILLRKKIVPELLQDNCTPRELTLETLKILRNPQKQRQQKEAFDRIECLLRPSKGIPSNKAASVIWSYLQSKKQ